MTKEELEKEAEEYFKSICGDYNEEYERTGKRHYFVGFDIKNAYLASAEPREKRIADLEKENAELKCECRRCVYSDCPCVLSDYGKDKNGICDHFKDVFDEIVELKADNDARKFAMAMSEKVEKQLREENAKLKDEWQEQVQKATDEGYARTLQTMQLTKAKELLKRYVPYRQITDSKAYKDLAEETEQFLNSEVEK